MLIISIVDLLNYHKIMNRQYEFIQTMPITRIETEKDYENSCNKHLTNLKRNITKLTIDESYSIKIVQASGKNFFGAFFVDRSGIRRPDSMPAGELWRYTTFQFDGVKQMSDQLDTLLQALNNAKQLREIVKVPLDDTQIYHSKIEFDLYGESGAWTLWYKTN